MPTDDGRHFTPPTFYKTERKTPVQVLCATCNEHVTSYVAVTSPDSKLLRVTAYCHGEKQTMEVNPSDWEESRGSQSLYFSFFEPATPQS